MSLDIWFLFNSASRASKRAKSSCCVRRTSFQFSDAIFFDFKTWDFSAGLDLPVYLAAGTANQGRFKP